MDIKTVDVALPGREYKVRIGSGLVSGVAAEIAPLLHRDRVAIITEANVAGYHLDALTGALAKAGIDAVTHVLRPGEGTKNWANLSDCVEWMLAEKIERRDVVIALGGGVIGDLVGFAAAILRRGIRFVQVPTSLLAQVDSSVGGKTGINSTHGKNLIGAFHQPSLVLADLDLLDTMPPRDLRAGYGEVVKYGLLGDADFFAWLEENGQAVLSGDKSAQLHAVYRSVQMKADIVERDETEQGDRAFLNLGHTFCHALENATGYSDRLLHGEGVAIGCGLAFELSARLGHVPQEAPSRVFAHLQEMGMKARLSDIPGDLPDAEALFALMGQDKKVLDGRIRFVLARDIGQAFVTDDVPRDEVLRLLADALG